MNLSIPNLPDDADVLTAALKYAEAGWYVLPVKRGSKHPGSVVGDNWQHQSSRDPEQIVAWFTGTDHGIAGHCGRSGALAFDVDRPELLPDVLRRHLDTGPYQSTRPDTRGRGHYPFLQPPGRTIGNSTGRLGGAWGEVRGLNGVIILNPTVHPEGGFYDWRRHGVVLVLPDELSELLPDSSPGEDAATDEQVAAFIAEHRGAQRPEILAGWVSALTRKIEANASCHMSTVSVLAGAMKEARAGFFGAQTAIDTLKPIFLNTVALGGSSGKVRVGARAEAEFSGVLAWAVGQANAADLDGVRARTNEKMPVNGAGPGTSTDDSVRAFKFPDGQRPTDVGNANRLLAHADGSIRYVHAWGKWIVYRHGRWIVDEKDALVTQTAKQVARGLYILAAKIATKDPDEAKPIWAWALKSDTSGAIAAMIRLARGVPGLLVNHEELDADPWLLNVENGTIDLRTGQLRAHDPADLCTLQAPVAYDPRAAAPLWETCLQCWQPDSDVRDYLQLRAGAGATGIPTETVDVDYGSGGNGKSKFHGATQHVLGPYATVPHKSLLVTGRFEQHATVIADLFRKRLAVASETKAAEALDDEQVKNLTGGDRLKGRRMREDPWEFWPTHTLIMFSNHKPAVRGRDEGIWRRLRLVPWAVTIAEDARDEGLAYRLQAESPGILRWMVAGARRFHQAGARLTPPDVVRAATEQYRRDEDVVGRFIAEVLAIGAASSHWCYSIDIKNELDAWCAEQDVDVPPSMQEIAATLQGLGCKQGGRKQIYGKRSTIWHGVTIDRQGW